MGTRPIWKIGIQCSPIIYTLDCYTLMSNHGHVVFTPLELEDGSYVSLPRIMHSLKGFTVDDIEISVGKLFRVEANF